MSLRHVRRSHPHLGTVLETIVCGVDGSVADAAATAVLDEVERLEQVFSAHRSDSELTAWTRGEVGEPSNELCSVLTAALDWQRWSHGAFNPMASRLGVIWKQAERDGVRPSPADLRDVADRISEPRFEIRGGIAYRTGDCSSLDLGAIAKGYIVDRAVEVGARSLSDRAAARDASSWSILVSAGGDMAHRGSPGERVGIENPLRPYDNEPPLDVIELSGAGLATSGGARRGVRIASERFGHVIDPRSGEPVRHHASISVRAPTAMVADVLATVAAVMEPAAAIARVEEHPGASGLVVGRDGSLLVGRSWGGDTPTSPDDDPPPISTH